MGAGRAVEVRQLYGLRWPGDIGRVEIVPPQWQPRADQPGLRSWDVWASAVLDQPVGRLEAQRWEQGGPVGWQGVYAGGRGTGPRRPSRSAAVADVVDDWRRSRG